MLNSCCKDKSYLIARQSSPSWSSHVRGGLPFAELELFPRHTEEKYLESICDKNCQINGFFISHYFIKKFLFETFIYLLIILILSERMGTMEHHLYLTRVLHTKIGVKFRGNNRKLITCQFDNASWTSWRDPTSSQVWSGPIPLSPRARTAEVRFPSKKCFK